MLVVLAIISVVPDPTGVAYATDQWNPAPGCGNRTVTRIGFTNDAQWNLKIANGPEAGKTLRQAVEYGRHDWLGSQIMHWQGYHAALRTGGDTFTMRWKPAWYVGGGDAKTQCTPMMPEIAFNSGHIPFSQNNSTRLRGVSTHEWGHAWGLGHIVFGRWRGISDDGKGTEAAYDNGPQACSNAGDHPVRHRVWARR